MWCYQLSTLSPLLVGAPGFALKRESYGHHLVVLCEILLFVSFEFLGGWFQCYGNHLFLCIIKMLTKGVSSTAGFWFQPMFVLHVFMLLSRHKWFDFQCSAKVLFSVFGFSLGSSIGFS